jgi:hypothetical protein
LTFTKPISTKLTDTQRHSIMSYIPNLAENRSKNVERTDKNSFGPLVKCEPHWTDVTKRKNTGQSFVMELYTEFHGRPTSDSVNSYRSQIDGRALHVRPIFSAFLKKRPKNTNAPNSFDCYTKTNNIEDEETAHVVLKSSRTKYNIKMLSYKIKIA